MWFLFSPDFYSVLIFNHVYFSILALFLTLLLFLSSSFIFRFLIISIECIDGQIHTLMENQKQDSKNADYDFPYILFKDYLYGASIGKKIILSISHICIFFVRKIVIFFTNVLSHNYIFAVFIWNEVIQELLFMRNVL